jgi:hypothetical protein
MRFVQDVNCEGTTRLKLALLYWICRRPDKGRGRGRIKAVIVIRERETCSWPEKYRARVSFANPVRVFGSHGHFHVLIILKTLKQVTL